MSLASTINNQQAVAVEESVYLTQREKQVLKLICEGDQNKQIGAKLGISIHTVIKHRDSVFKKLNAHSAVEAFRAGIKLGLVTIN